MLLDELANDEVQCRFPGGHIGVGQHVSSHGVGFRARMPRRRPAGLVEGRGNRIEMENRRV